jgi:hypothetical protein
MQRPSPGLASRCEGLTTKEESPFPMDTQNPSAPTRVQSRNTGKNHPHAGGLVHDNARHTTRFTVIGNHLAQHPSLSGLAIGLAVYIQSLPARSSVDIKTLAARFPEGTTRIAAALRELEAHGYLRRERQRLPSGRIVTRTISCNQPGHRANDTAHPPRPRPASPKKTPPKPLPPVPRPTYPSPALIRQATDLLADLPPPRPPPVAQRTRRSPAGPRRRSLAGTGRGPHGRTRSPDHRPPGTAPVPPGRPPGPPPDRPVAAPPPFRAASPPAVPHPLRNCDGCDRAFRGPAPGHCSGCRTELSEAA